MMMNNTKLGLAGALILFAFSASCGGSSAVLSGGGVTGTGLARGPITDFGSIFVSDIEFDLAGAAVFVEGSQVAESALRLGMIVRVRGDIDSAAGTGRALSVTFNDDIEGPVAAKDTAAGTLTLLGQTVLVDAATVFDGTTFQTLAIGAWIEVSGLVDAAGAIHATRIELRSSSRLEVTGLISTFNGGAQTFTINGLTVDFSTADVRDAPPGGLTSGLHVEVRSDRPLSGGMLLADRVDVEDDDNEGSQDGDELRVAGFITSVQSSSVFNINGSQAVRTAFATRFHDGTSADIAVNRLVRVDGTLDASMVLVAEDVRF